MARSFKARRLRERTLWQKLVGKANPDNAIPELRNNLATAQNILDFTQQHFVALCDKYGGDIRTQRSAELLEIYREFLEYCLADGIISESQEQELAHLRYIFGVSAATHNNLAKTISLKVYTGLVATVIAKEAITDGEREHLKTIADYLGLNDREATALYKKTAGKLIKNRFDMMMADNKFSPEEERHLEHIAEKLNVELSFSEASQRLMERNRLLWSIANEPLPIVDTHLNLMRGEVCYYRLNIEWYEMRKQRAGTHYAGPTMRIKIADGLYWRAGSIAHTPMTRNTLTLIDHGELCLTNKRLLFLGSEKTKTIQISKILDFTPYSDGVEIAKGTGKNPFLIFDDDVDIFVATLARAIQDY